MYKDMTTTEYIKRRSSGELSSFVSARVSPEFKKRIEESAENEGVSLSGYIIVAILRALERSEKAKKGANK